MDIISFRKYWWSAVAAKEEGDHELYRSGLHGRLMGRLS